MSRLRSARPCPRDGTGTGEDRSGSGGSPPECRRLGITPAHALAVGFTVDEHRCDHRPEAAERVIWLEYWVRPRKDVRGERARGAGPDSRSAGEATPLTARSRGRDPQSNASTAAQLNEQLLYRTTSTATTTDDH